MKRIIFLDHDGVVCLWKDWGSRSKKKSKYAKEHGIIEVKEMPVHVRFDNFDRKAVAVLNEILQKTNAEIVVSSDWKLSMSLEELQELYRSYGVVKVPIGVTPNLKAYDSYMDALCSHKGWHERARCLEIEKWLEENVVDSWVAVDDLNMSNEHLQPGLDHFVHTPKSLEGIKQSGVADKIVEALTAATQK